MKYVHEFSVCKHVLLENMVKVGNVCNSYADDLVDGEGCREKKAETFSLPIMLMKMVMISYYDDAVSLAIFIFRLRFFLLELYQLARRHNMHA